MQGDRYWGHNSHLLIYRLVVVGAGNSVRSQHYNSPMTCRICKTEKADAEFYMVDPSRSRRDSTCKECRKARIRAERAADPETFRERGRRSYQAHREAYIARARQWQRENPEAVARRSRKWAQKNPDKVRDYVNLRRARLMASGVEKIDRVRVFERDGGRCHICGELVSTEKFELDHLVPISKGGSHTYANVRVAHPSCNRRRSDGVLPAQLLLIG